MTYFCGEEVEKLCLSIIHVDLLLIKSSFVRQHFNSDNIK